MSKIWFYVSHRPVIVSKRAYLFKSQNYNEINRYGIIITMEWSSLFVKILWHIKAEYYSNEHDF